MELTFTAAAWFLPFALPICIWVAWNDMRVMKIPNVAVYALFAVFAVIGLIALPLDEYLWRYVHLVVVLIAGILLNAIGAFGAGDAKFAAVAAPFIALGDLGKLTMLFATCVVAGLLTHRLAKNSPIRKLVPHWESWTSGKRFPLGLPLGATLAFYLALGLFYGA
jgi:prepilin peptidase CpaA